MVLILQNIEMSMSNFAEMKSGVIFCKKVISHGFFRVIFVFGNRVNGILRLSWDFIKGILIFQVTEGTNLQKLKISKPNFAEVKTWVTDYRKCISQGTNL